MPTTHLIHDDGIAEIVMDNPPVNALTVAGWFGLADLLTELGRDPKVRVVVLRAEGRGFNAGVDIKEMQATEGFDALIGANKGCFAAFAAVYDCPVPVVAAVQRLLPRRRHRPRRQRRRHRGRRRRHLRPARGGPRRPRRGDPPEPARPAAQDAGDGLHVGHRDRAGAAPLRLGAAGRPPGRAPRPRRWRWPPRSPAKSPTVIRAAKESLNGIDLWDVKRSYRFEQGFTFELNLSGVADEHRDAFVAKRETDVEK